MGEPAQRYLPILYARIGVALVPSARRIGGRRGRERRSVGGRRRTAWQVAHGRAASALALAVATAGAGLTGAGARAPAGAEPSSLTIAPAVGPTGGGTNVVVSGPGLARASGVRFGSLPAAYWRLDPPGPDGSPTLSAVSPPQAPGPVAVTVAFATGDQAAGTFSYYPDVWRATGTMAVAHTRGSTATALADGRTLVAGGAEFGCIQTNTTHTTSDCDAWLATEVFDPAGGSPGGWGAWTRTANLRVGRRGHVATLLDPPFCHPPATPPAGYPCGAVLVTGGIITGGSSLATSSAELYRPDTGTWTPTTEPMSVTRTRHTATLLATGEVLVVGGAGGDAPYVYASAELYDPITDAWKPAPALPTEAGARYGHSATLLDRADCHGPQPPADGYPCGAVLVAGGSDANDQATTSAELFVPAAPAPPAATGSPPPPAGTWLPVAPMGGNGGEAGASLLPDGRVVLAQAAATEVLRLDRTVPGGEPLGQWHDAGAPPLRISGAPLTVTLPDGGVLAVGETAATARFDPAAGGGGGAWAPAAPLAAAHGGGTATLLAGGAVLVAGGGSAVLPTPAEVLSAGAEPPPRIDAVAPPVGPSAGGSVTITGSGLFPPTAVRFDTLDAAVTFASDTELTVTAPPRPPGTVARVSVSTAAGTTPAASAPRYAYADGTWAHAAPLDDCAPAPGCTGRTVNVAVALDPPACRGEGGPLPDGYPCGSVLDVGRDNRAMTVLLTSGSDQMTAVTGEFGPGDVGRSLTTGSPRPPVISSVAEDRKTATIDQTWDRPTTSAKTLSLVGTSAERYDPASGRWTATEPLPAQLVNDLGASGPIWAQPAGALLADGDVLVAGGVRYSDGSTPLDQVDGTAELYHPATNSWTATESMHPRQGHTATVLDRPDCHRAQPPADGYPCGKVLVAGGFQSVATDAAGDGVIDAPAEAQLFDPAGGEDHTGSWTDTEPMKVARYGHTATLLTGPACTVATPPSYCGEVLVTGGSNAVFGDPALRSAELFDPVRGTWRLTTAGGALTQMARYRMEHTATLLDPPACHAPAGPPARYPCGQVLVTGGFGIPGEADGRAGAELYDPAAGTWTALAGQLGEGRALHTATLLPNGRVLVAGGSSSSSAFVAGAEVFDPQRSTWAAAPPMGVGRVFHTATLLRTRCGTNCGRVLVAGGDCPVVPTLPRGCAFVWDGLAATELYTPPPAVSNVSPATGPSSGGTQVVVSGAGFSLLGPAPSVRFGGVAATGVVVDSDTSLRATAPAHPSGAADVEVLGAAGSSALAAPDPAARFGYGVSQAPAAVGDLAASATSEAQVVLRFSAVAADGAFPPPAGRYVIKQSTAPITDQAGFDAAQAVCGAGGCSFAPAAVGKALTLLVGELSPATTYHYALEAVNEAGLAGPVSNDAAATTTGQAGRRVGPEGPEPPEPGGCGPPPATGPHQVAYPAGWSLVGGAGALAGAGPKVYGWLDQGAGGRYSLQDADHPLARGRGYWAWFACPAAVNLPATSAPVTLPLGPYHASLVGNPAAAPVRVSGYDYAARWDRRLNAGAGGYQMSGYRQAETLAPGEGMWVFAYTASTVTIAP